MKKLVSVLLAICVIFSLFAGVSFTALAETEEFYTYIIESGSATITAASPTLSGEVEIPQELGGCPVTAIDMNAFKDCVQITGVTIPQSVTSIGDTAFFGCLNLANINIPTSVTSIGVNAFLGTAHHFNNMNDDLLYVGDCLVYASINAEGDVAVKDGTRLIADYAFNGCSKITAIELPSSLKHIGLRAFMNCAGLASVVIPEGTESLGSYAFGGCTNLASIELPDSLLILGGNAFDDTAFYNDPNNWDNSVLYINNCLIKCELDEVDYEIKEGTTAIAGKAFYNRQLLSITMPNSVKGIGEFAFYECTAELQLPSSLKYIGWGAFFYSFAQGELKITDPATIIGINAFACSSLTSVSLADGIKNIPDGMFQETYALESIFIPSSVTHVGDYVFNGCANLKIYGIAGSYAETYANEKNIPFIYLAEYIEGEGFITTESTGVYSIVNSELLKANVLDDSGNAIQYNENAKGWPLLGGKEYTVLFDNIESVSSKLYWFVQKTNATVFPDAFEGGWYYDAVAYAAGQGIIKGYADGSFGTADGIQRQDFLVMLARYDGVNLDDYANIHGQFPDVGAQSYYEAAVNWGFEKGIVTGYENGNFGVGDMINREQIVTFFYRYANFKEIDVSVTDADKEIIMAQFADYNDITDYAKEAVLWGVNKGVIKGKSPTTIAPAGEAQRCEIAQIIYNIYNNEIFKTDELPGDSGEGDIGGDGSGEGSGDEPIVPDTPTEPTNPYDEIASENNIDLITERVLYYIKQYRETPATSLSGLNGLAKYRSTQLTSNFSHDMTDILSAHTALQYGETFKINGETYYTSSAKEAIAQYTLGDDSIDTVASLIATALYENTDAWSYVGSYGYIGLGATYADGVVYVCIEMDEEGIYG